MNLDSAKIVIDIMQMFGNQNGFRPHATWTSRRGMDLLNDTSAYRGSGGPPPPEKFWLQGSQFVHSSAILGHSTLIPPPYSLKMFSHQIYNDLENDPGSWKKD